MVDIHYVYTKPRKEFGKPCIFSDKPAEIIVDVMPSPQLRDQYVLVSPVDREVQHSSLFTDHEVNTEVTTSDSHAINHMEGGWPRDINPFEGDQVSRFRKKVEKDDNYIFSVLGLAQSIEHCIRQNNAVNIYEDYFSDVFQEDMESPPTARSLNVFRDAASTKRSVTSIVWNPENAMKIAVSYANIVFQGSNWSDVLDSYIWDIDTPQKPDVVLKPKSHIMKLEYNPKDSHVLLGGCYSGQICFWDDRKGPEPVNTTNQLVSHTDPCHCVVWLMTKTGTEFFSSGTDGRVKWWDTRKLSEPLEQVILDVTRKGEILSAHGATVMEFEPTMATKFMVGTEQGTVVVGNRKGKTVVEKIAAVYSAHLGPVYALQRNPLSLKNYLTVGDWTARVWAEDVKESSIVWTRYSPHFLTNACWNPARPSVFFASTTVGTIEAWDLLFKQKEPTLRIQISDEPLECVKVQEQGNLLATGSLDGNTTLVEVSEALSTSGKNDKSVLTSMFEREVFREKTLEARYREMRFKKPPTGGTKDEGDVPMETLEANCRKVFFESVGAFAASENRKRHAKRVNDERLYEKETSEGTMD